MKEEKLEANHKSVRRWKYDSYKGDKRKKTYYSKGKNITVDKAFPLVLEAMKQGIGAHTRNPTSSDWLKEIYYSELIAVHLGIKSHVVKQVFHKLNLKGVISQRVLWTTKGLGYMHTRLDSDDVVQWEAKRYFLNLEKFEKFYNEYFK